PKQKRRRTPAGVRRRRGRWELLGVFGSLVNFGRLDRPEGLGRFGSLAGLGRLGPLFGPGFPGPLLSPVLEEPDPPLGMGLQEAHQVLDGADGPWADVVLDAFNVPLDVRLVDAAKPREHLHQVVAGLVAPSQLSLSR